MSYFRPFHGSCCPRPILSNTPLGLHRLYLLGCTLSCIDLHWGSPRCTSFKCSNQPLGASIHLSFSSIIVYFISIIDMNLAHTNVKRVYLRKWLEYRILDQGNLKCHGWGHPIRAVGGGLQVGRRLVRRYETGIYYVNKLPVDFFFLNPF